MSTATTYDTRPDLTVGGMMYFEREKRGYRIRARSDRFIVGTKPIVGSYLYTIVDLKEGARGPDDRVFGPAVDWIKPRDAAVGIRMLEHDRIDLSRRNSIPLDFRSQP